MPDGFQTGLFLVVVQTTRFCLEFLKTRQAVYDAELPLSIGQCLCIPAIAIGAVLLLLKNKNGFDVIKEFE